MSLAFRPGRLLLALLCLALVPALLSAEDLPRVLILNSYHDGFAWSDGIMEGIESELGGEADLYIEYMDTKRFAYDRLKENLQELYRYKYGPEFFDLIITSDDNALQFMLDYRSELFPETPLVFCGVNNPQLAASSRDQNLTGLRERNDHYDTILALTQLLPNTETLLVVTDNTTSGMAQYAQLKAISKNQNLGLSFEFLNDDGEITLSRLHSRLARAGANTAVYFSDLYLDGNGDYLLYESYLRELIQSYPVPFIGHGEFFLGYGILGGKINSGYYQGDFAGELATRILDGAKLSSISVQLTRPNRYIFDAKALNRFGIPRGRLPEGSILINEETTRAELFRRWVLPSLGGVIFFASLSLILALNIRRRQLAELRLAREKEFFYALLDHIPDFIYFKDEESRFLKINRALANHYKLDDPSLAEGRSDLDFYPEETAMRTRREEEEIMRTLEPIINLEEQVDYYDGTYWQSTTKLPMFDELGRIIGTCGISRDITERRNNIERLSRSLEEKNILLKEIHHRVKNNLQIISSLLSLQSSYLQEETLVNTFQESILRIHSMAHIHETIYSSGSFSAVDMNSYVHSLVDIIHQTLAPKELSLDISFELDDTPLEIDKAILCGLILTEIVTNAYKHAFKGCSSGTLRIEYQNSGENARLSIADSGSGAEPNILEREHASLGITLIKSLSLQLNGSLSFRYDEGSIFMLEFPVS